MLGATCSVIGPLSAALNAQLVQERTGASLNPTVGDEERRSEPTSLSGGKGRGGTGLGSQVTHALGSPKGGKARPARLLGLGPHRSRPSPRRPAIYSRVAEMSWVVSVIVMFVNATVIGGLQSGWNVAVAVSVNSACPFCTGKSPAAETLVLFAASG
jgi:hypothetical protein